MFRRMTARPVSLLAAVAVATVLLLTACGGDGDDTSPTAVDTNTATPGSATGPTATRTPGGTPVDTPAGSPGDAAECDENDVERGVGATLSFGRDELVFDSSEDVEMTVTIKNCGDEDVTLYFVSSQRYDIVIEEADSGLAVWSSSDDKAFAPALSEEVIALGETIVYEETWDQEDSDGERVDPGTYKVSAFSVGCTAEGQANCRFGPVTEIVIQ